MTTPSSVPDTAAHPPLHVLLLVENLPVPADYRAWLIARTLRDAGYRVTVISPATTTWPAGEELREGIRILRHPLPCEARRWGAYVCEYGAALWQELRLSIRVFRRARFHIIHACNPPDLLWLIGLCWRLRGVRFVYDHHDLCPELVLAKTQCAMPQQLRGWARGLYILALVFERITHWCAHRVLATNDSYRAISLQRDRYPAARITTVKTAPTRADIAAAPQHVPRPTGPLTIAYVGVMAAQDGVDGLLRAVRRLRDAHGCTAAVTLIGDGPERTALEQLAASLGIAAQVRFTGFLPRAEMLAALAQCDVGVTPDPPGPMNNASTMLKALDYMLCGLPQVMYDLPENRATAAATAVYARPGDEGDLAATLARVLADASLRAALAAGARARIGTLAWEDNGAPALRAVYAALAACVAGTP
jgi:glycosyltransferase involved in cell wall biosynthesis